MERIENNVKEEAKMCREKVRGNNMNKFPICRKTRV